MMTTLVKSWWDWMVGMSWQVTLLVIVVGAFCFFRQRISARVLYALWLLVLLKLVLPPDAGHRYSLVGLLVQTGVVSIRPSPADVSKSQDQFQVANEIDATGEIKPVTNLSKPSSIAQPANERQPVAFQARKQRLTYKQILCMMWLLGVGAILLRTTGNVRRFSAWLRAHAETPPSWFEDEIAALCRDVGIHAPPKCYLIPAGISPCLWRWFKPSILFPTDLVTRLTREQLRILLCHELLHIKRRDTIMNGLQNVVQMFYWFHPLVWIAGREIRHHREMAVDEEVASTLGNLSAHSYEQTILAVSDEAARHSMPAMVGIAEPRHFIFRRVVRLLESSAGSARAKERHLLGWVLLALFAVFFLPMGISRIVQAESGDVKQPPTTVATTTTAEVNYLGQANFPRVVELDPPNGAVDVDPGRKHITVTFDRLMRNGYSWVDKGKRPKIEKIEWTNERQCRASVSLEPDREYGVWLNFGPNTSKFRSREGVSAERVYWTFRTAKTSQTAEVSSPKPGTQEPIAALDSKKESVPVLSSPLQSQIDKAKPGDVVAVPAGTHAGPLRISQPITLRGEDAKKCTIELLGDEPTITIKGAKDVVLEDLTVRWSQKSTDARLDAPAAIYVRDSDVVIRGCRLEPIDRPKDTPYGMMAAGRTNATFTEGRSTGFAYTLIFLDGANGTVSNSVLTDAGHSVVTLQENSSVKIVNNILGRCDYHAVRNTGGTMDMRNNLVIGNNRAGAYLGNKSAHGTIANNLFTQSRGEIWGYAQSDVVIENNVFYASNGPGIGFQETCKFTIRQNSFVGNAQGLARYAKEGTAHATETRAQGNHYWNNKEDFQNVEGDSGALRGDPKFTDPDKGDFAAQKGSPLLDNTGQTIAGLTNPEPIKTLWATWANLAH